MGARAVRCREGAGGESTSPDPRPTPRETEVGRANLTEEEFQFETFLIRKFTARMLY